MKLIRSGILFIIIPIAAYCLVVFLNNEFLFYKLFFTRHKSDKYPVYVQLFPIIHEDGTIECEGPNNFESKIFILNPDQVASYKKFASLNEPLYRFTIKNPIEGIKNGSLIINNDNDEIKIKMYLPSVGRYMRNYSGEYELTDNMLIILNANYNFISRLKILLFFGLMFFSIFIGFMIIVRDVIMARLKRDVIKTR